MWQNIGGIANIFSLTIGGLTNHPLVTWLHNNYVILVGKIFGTSTTISFNIIFCHVAMVLVLKLAEYIATCLLLLFGLHVHICIKEDINGSLFILEDHVENA